MKGLLLLTRLNNHGTEDDMTDRIHYLTVILDNDYRTDDVEDIVAAINMIRGVDAVELGKPVTGNDHMARTRVRIDLLRQIAQLIKGS